MDEQEDAGGTANRFIWHGVGVPERAHSGDGSGRDSLFILLFRVTSSATLSRLQK